MLRCLQGGTGRDARCRYTTEEGNVHIQSHREETCTPSSPLGTIKWRQGDGNGMEWGGDASWRGHGKRMTKPSTTTYRRGAVTHTASCFAWRGAECIGTPVGPSTLDLIPCFLFYPFLFIDGDHPNDQSCSFLETPPLQLSSRPQSVANTIAIASRAWQWQ